MGCRYEIIPIENIILDRENPRIARWLEMYTGEITEEQFAMALGAGPGKDADQSGPTYATLKRSIETNKGIIHPIIVTPTGDGKFLVIEGNTRVLIYKTFKNEKKPGDWTAIPSMVYEEMDPVTRDAIRLQAHLVGTREWDPYSKAKYLDFLRNKQHLTYAQIIDFCGGNAREVENYIQAYKDMETHYREILESDDEFDASRFSAFVELQSTRVTETLLQHGISKKEFSKWVQDKKIYPINTVRSLPRIFGNTKAKEAFLKYGAQEAIKLLDAAPQGEELTNADITQLSRELIKKIAAMPYAEIKKLKSGDSDERDLIHDAVDALQELWGDIKPED